MALHGGKQLGFGAAALQAEQSVEGINLEKIDERVTRLMQARNETAEIEARALMEPPRGSFNRRNKETDPLRSRKKGCASEKRD